MAFEYNALNLADFVAGNVQVHTSNAGPWRDVKIDNRVKERGAKWYGGLKSMDQASALLSEGWQEGADRAQSLSAQISDLPAPKTRRRVGVWADQGDDLNVDRALRGDWDQAWRTSRRQTTSGPQILNLVIGWGGPHSLTQDQLFWAGAAGVIIADALENAGYAVAIHAVNVAEFYSNDVLASVLTVKETSEPVRIDAITGVLCHGGIFRSIGFLAKCAQSKIRVDSSMGVTQSVRDNKDKLVELGAIAEQSMIVDCCYTREDAVTQIQEALTQFCS